MELFFLYIIKKTMYMLNEKATSKSQQRLMGMVYAYKNGDLDLDKLSPSLADKIKSIADGSRRKTGDRREKTKGIDKSSARDFASTKHKGLPEKVEESKDNGFNNVKRFDDFISEKVSSEIKKDNKHAEVAIKSLDLRNQAHIFHWQTLSGTHHEALGEFYDSFLGKLDELVEYTMGKYGRFSVVGLEQTKLVDYDDEKCCDLLQEYHDYYHDLKVGLYKSDDAMTAVLDEIMGDILKLKYLLSME